MFNEFDEIDEIAYNLFCEDYKKIMGSTISASTLNYFLISKTTHYYKEAEHYLRRKKIIKILNNK